MTRLREELLEALADEERALVKQLGGRIGFGRVIQICEELFPDAHTVLERKELELKVRQLTVQRDNAREQAEPTAPMNCPDCNKVTDGNDVIEGSPHCRYCGHYLGSEP